MFRAKFRSLRSMPRDVTDRAASKILVHRHPLLVRLTHWINVACLCILLLSGLQIFNAHPSLYWGHYGADGDSSFIDIRAYRDGASIRGETRIGSIVLPTTGFLGASDVNGQLKPRAFPSWLTIPSYQDLATGRRWHFFFAWLFVANGIIYLLYGVLAGHFRRRLIPAASELTPSHLAVEIADHARLRFPRGERAHHYNALQKLAYLAVILILLPLMLATGLSMSPAMDAAWPWLIDIFGGRQSARTIHFIAAALIVGFVFIHVAMVLVSGVWNNLRSMVTGRYAIEIERTP